MINKISQFNNNSYNPNFSGENKNLTRKQKATILGSAILTTAPTMAYLAHRRGFSLNPLRILKTPIKNWALFKSTPIDKAIKFEAPQIIAIASSSVAGGFVGGAIVDNKNLQAKKREVLNQIFGNVLAPVGCVWTGAKIFEFCEKPMKKALPHFEGSGKVAKFMNSLVKNLPNIAFTLGFLGIGIYVGNRVSNFINEKIYKKPVDRSIRPSDFAPHIDDVCMATTMMNPTSDFGTRLGRVVPFALLVPGYKTGVAQDN